MKTNTNLLKLTAWSGIIGPALFILIFTVEGWIRQGYHPFEMYVSELALGPRGWIQIVNFLIYGILFLLFAVGISIGFKRRLGSITLAIIGISIIAAGFFVMDPVTTLPSQISWYGKLHSLAGAFVFGLWPISCFVFWRHFSGAFRHWTLLAGLITAVSAILMSVGPTKAPAVPNEFNQWIGLIQRISIFTYLSWQFTFALKLLRKL